MGRLLADYRHRDVGDARWHALRASSDGTGMSFVAVASEIADPADMSVVVGLATNT